MGSFLEKGGWDITNVITKSSLSDEDFKNKGEREPAVIE